MIKFSDQHTFMSLPAIIFNSEKPEEMACFRTFQKLRELQKLLFQNINE